MTETQPTIPVPEPDEASRPFFDGAAAGRLMLMRCIDCQTWRLPARQHCDVCLSDRYTWEAASGRGRVRTFGIMHQRYHPAFQVPYNVTVVELDEGPRLPTNLVEVANEDIYVGMSVEVVFERYDDVTLPRFRPVRDL
ncbi:Zn-ribbon domain-containing OB-fold protein [Tepidiforma thermophila]|uniref:DNA-binding protein n=1 Tax=Tepidiforma thermophila (strain KCTC 52669 / CGMCC 1.13589 / G233) TaxID=2761530 RepID=A0A2A9HF12_TEPT2|nr:OB-fold domain-containing protein [Tepidiforma thermophila]PFG74617.1 hypothetical protein A9A59_1854 [Tepidiforma thermophila]